MIAHPCFNHLRASRWLSLFLLAGLATGLAHANFFVAPGGSDADAGTLDKPFATLERARDAVRALKKSGQMPASVLTVFLRQGDYVRTNALELTETDSGTEKSPIVWEAYGQERVRLLGGRLLTGFQPVTDAAVLARLDTAARSHVVQLDLRALGITDFGEMKSRGFNRPTIHAHCELFFGGRPMTLARWPNEGEWAKIAGFPAGTGKSDNFSSVIGGLTNGFFYSGDRPRRWKDIRDLWVHGYWDYDWANSYEHVASLDPDQHLVTTAPPYGQYGFRTNQRFYFLNVLEELDQPGEWFLDRKSGLLYFWPPSPVASAEALLSLSIQPLFRLKGASNLIIRNLVLEATRGSAIDIEGGTGNRIVSCVLRNLGNLGVTVTGGTGHGVIGCDILDTGDGGVYMSGGDRETLASGRHFVENCHFQRQARWSKCYAPAIELKGVGLRASHNLVHDHPHAGIIFWGNDILVEFNEVHHVALETGDVGAIYTGRDYTFRGNRIRNNFVHETGGVGLGSMGVYMDDCVSGTEIFGNIFQKVQRAAFIGGGRDHQVENNLFVDCDPAVQADGRGIDPKPMWQEMVGDVMRKRLTAMPSALYRQRYPAIKSLDAYYGAPASQSSKGPAFKGVPPEGNVIAHNVCVGKWLSLPSNPKPEQFNVHDNFVTTDSRQVGTAANGFRLPQDSPAWKLGFQPIPFDQIGLRPDAIRQRLAHLQ